MKEVHLWAREDGEQPKAIAPGSKPPGPGRVYAVRARSSDEARRTLAAWAALTARRDAFATEAERAAFAHGQPLLAEVREVTP